MKETKVHHPDGGHVVFTEPTVRQKQILAYYDKLYEANKELESRIKHMPNDQSLGKSVRKDFITWEV